VSTEPEMLSVGACADLITAHGAGVATGELSGMTDCPDGCIVEPDGQCPHGWLSAEETLLRTSG
jgi:hypothetical protein